jgi:hypothetical protein
MAKRQRIFVVQQNGSAEAKVAGIRQFGRDAFELEVFSIDEPLPPVLDESEGFLPDTIDADLVLDFLTHPDLSYDLGLRCRELKIPVVASGKKHRIGGVVTPPICCGLSRQVSLGRYGEIFGAPEFSAEVENGLLVQLDVIRGAPCGATWRAAQKVVGLPAEQAVVRIGLETQFFCVADPSSWDPLWGKSPVHFAGKVHSKALERALQRKCLTIASVKCGAGHA